MKRKLSVAAISVLLPLLCSTNFAQAQSALDLGTSSQVRNSIIFQNPYATPVSEGVSVRFSASDSLLPVGNYNVPLSETPFSTGFRIDRNSDVFDGGSRVYLGASDTLDLDFNPRVSCRNVDIGAFEFIVQPTQITVQPTLVGRACEGTEITLHVEAIGEGLTFQWQRNGENLVGRTNSSFTISDVTISDTGYYRVIAIGTCYSDTSYAVRLDVDLRPMLVIMNDTVITSGEDVTLRVIDSIGTVVWLESDRVTVVTDRNITNITETRHFFAVATNGVCADSVRREVWITVSGLGCYVQAPTDTLICPGAPYNLRVYHSTVEARWFIVGTDIEVPSNVTQHLMETTRFVLRGFDASGEVCTTDTLVVSVQPMPNLEIQPQPPIHLGTSIHLVSEPQAQIWTDINGTQVFMPLTPQHSQYFIAIYQLGDCEVKDTIFVHVIASLPALTLETWSFDGCFSGDGEIEVEVLNGTAPFTFEWTPGTTTTSMDPIVRRENLTPGSYIVIVTDALGATGTASVTIGLVAPLTIHYVIETATNEPCNDGRINVFAIEGVEPFFFEWTNALTGEFVSDAQNLTHRPSGIFNLIVADSRGCQIELEDIVLGCTYERVMPTILVTPNSDGFNDYLYIENIHLYPINTVTIFNSYGAEVATIRNYDNGVPNRRWNGRDLNNRYVSDGTYWYVVQTEGVPPMIGWIIVRLSPTQ